MGFASRRESGAKRSTHMYVHLRTISTRPDGRGTRFPPQGPSPQFSMASHGIMSDHPAGRPGSELKGLSKPSQHPAFLNMLWWHPCHCSPCSDCAKGTRIADSNSFASSSVCQRIGCNRKWAGGHAGGQGRRSRARRRAQRGGFAAGFAFALVLISTPKPLADAI
jgi:hypothetical protein